MTAEDAPIARRSAIPFLVLGGATLLSLAGNIWGGLNFPYNAPVEQLTCFGFVVDGAALLIVTVIGLIVVRQNLGVRSTSVLATIGLSMTALALAGVIGLGGIPSLIEIGQGYRLHYSTETGPAFFLAPVWITGLAFCAFAYRRGVQSRGNLQCILGLAFGIAVFLLAAASAVVYGLGLST
jgi:hypothetical protein